MPHAVCDLLGNCVIGVQITAHNLDVNGGGQAEIQDLADDIGRLEKKLGSRKVERKIFAQLLNVVYGGMMMLLIQRDEDLGVRCANGSAGAIGGVNRTERQTDIIENGR